MVRLYLLIILTFFCLAVPKQSAAQYGNFAGLDEVTIVVSKLENEAKELGLDESAIENQVQEFLQTNLPYILVRDPAEASIWVIVNIAKSRAYHGYPLGYFGSVSVGVRRRVMIMNTGKLTSAYLWYDTHAITGGKSSLREHIHKVVENILASFASAWKQDNPAK